jgi:hypothetical protein
MGTIKHTLIFSYNAAHCSSHCSKRTHKAVTVTFNKSHIARAINTRRRQNENKKKEKENTLPAISAYTRRKLKQAV